MTYQLRALEVATPILMFTAMNGELYETASLDAGASTA
jgi:DNA-binding response OmpR family regulator